MTTETRRALEWLDGPGTVLVPEKVLSTLKRKFGYFSTPQRERINRSGSPTAQMRRDAANDLDLWFSRFIRLRDTVATGEGRRIGKCSTCQLVFDWRSLECGHWIRRANHAVRVDERNANALCTFCNRSVGGKEKEHEAFIRDLNGDRIADLLQSKQFERFHKKILLPEAQQKTAYYKSKCLEMGWNEDRS